MRVDAPAQPRIPITKPLIGQEEYEAIREPLDTGWLVQGPIVKTFETKFASYIGAAEAVATSSCTTALHTAVASLGLGPGDEVLVPAFTWVATPNVVEYMGAKPVFCDIDLGGFNVDVRALEQHLTSRTVGIIPVHLFGLSADMDPILALARRHGLWVVEDAACGFGAFYRGHHVGTLGDAGCFSFHPRKSITTGEGGMITTNQPVLAAKARSLRDHGATRSDLDRHTGSAGYLLPSYDELGYNYRLTDIQAAIGVVQLGRADWILNRRRELATRYDAALADLPWLVRPTTPEGSVHGFQSYVCLYAPEPPSLEALPRLHQARNRLMEAMDNLGVATRQGTHAPVRQGYYARKYAFETGQFPAAELADQLSISLPLYPQMSEADQDRVLDSLRRAFAN
jgi:dTDP-4-amino-4,6-dideoxygalactose transaminase